jgi:hypothetical protein
MILPPFHSAPKCCAVILRRIDNAKLYRWYETVTATPPFSLSQENSMSFPWRFFRPLIALAAKIGREF